MFLLWPLLLAVVMVNIYWSNFPSVLGYLAVVALVCLTTSTIALFCSVMFRKTSISLMTTYLLIVLLFTAPLGVSYFAANFFADASVTPIIAQASFTSPFAVVFKLPIDLAMSRSEAPAPDWWFLASFLGFYLAFDGLLLATVARLFNVRWRME